MRRNTFLIFICVLVVLGALFFRLAPRNVTRTAANLAQSVEGSAARAINAVAAAVASPTLRTQGVIKDPDPAEGLALGDQPTQFSVARVEAVTDVAPENKPMTVSDSTQPTEQATRAVVAQNAVEAPESSSNSTDSLQRGNSAAQRANDLLMQAIKAADEAKAQMLIAQKELQRDMRASLNLEKIAASESKRNRQKTSEAPAAGNELESTLAANTLRFAWMKSTLDEDSNKKIARVVAELKKNPEIDIQITGHTDNNGTEDLNKWLGLIRARRVRQQLIAQGIEPKRISVHSSGSASPIAENDTAEGRWKNRRVEFSVSAK